MIAASASLTGHGQLHALYCMGMFMGVSNIFLNLRTLVKEVPALQGYKTLADVLFFISFIVIRFILMWISGFYVIWMHFLAWYLRDDSHSTFDVTSLRVLNYLSIFKLISAGMLMIGAHALAFVNIFWFWIICKMAKKTIMGKGKKKSA